MNAFILETLLSRGWRRGGEVYWTRSDAEQTARILLKRKVVRGVRILPIQVELNPVAEFPAIAMAS